MSIDAFDSSASISDHLRRVLVLGVYMLYSHPMRSRRPWQPCAKLVLSIAVCVVVIGLWHSLQFMRLGGDDGITRAFEGGGDPRVIRPASGNSLAIIVVPSPPTVPGPMTRIDRLKAISETWGDDFLRGHGSRRDHGHSAENRCASQHSNCIDMIIS